MCCPAQPATLTTFGHQDSDDCIHATQHHLNRVSALGLAGESSPPWGSGCPAMRCSSLTNKQFEEPTAFPLIRRRGAMILTPCPLGPRTWSSQQGRETIVINFDRQCERENCPRSARYLGPSSIEDPYQTSLGQCHSQQGNQRGVDVDSPQLREQGSFLLRYCDNNASKQGRPVRKQVLRLLRCCDKPQQSV